MFDQTHFMISSGENVFKIQKCFQKTNQQINVRASQLCSHKRPYRTGHMLYMDAITRTPRIPFDIACVVNMERVSALQWRHLELSSKRMSSGGKKRRV